VIYNGDRSNVTSAATTDLIVLHAGSGESARVWQVNLSGEASASVPMRSRFCRASTAGSSPTTAVDQQLTTPGRASALDCVTTVTSPTRAPGSLLPGLSSWNAFGGIIRYHAGPKEIIRLEGDVTGYAQAILRNEAGVATIGAGVQWEE
jgi:hypothetical protein